jgi:demethylmenaquinone methyltransferase / 2-methoxy-6-polyprenyl-1,4-benzoquinol methylase
MPSPVWSRDDLADPHGMPDKDRRVRSMFAAIAPSYDLNNRLHSLWRDQAWRRAAVRAAELRPGDVVLDVACGTGDLALAFVRGGAAHVLGVDFTFEMLHFAASKTPKTSPHDAAPLARPLLYAAGDAMRLPLPDASVDVVSIAFGIRNVSDPARALAEFHRVLRPGGRLVVLEFSLPAGRLLRGLYNFYFRQILPRTATLIARDRTGAYRYLPRSVNTFIDRAAMLNLMAGTGFISTRQRALTLGIAVIYTGRKG